MEHIRSFKMEFGTVTFVSSHGRRHDVEVGYIGLGRRIFFSLSLSKFIHFGWTRGTKCSPENIAGTYFNSIKILTDTDWVCMNLSSQK